MPIQPIPVALDKGLNLVDSALSVEPGSLIDCLNYEITADTGYRRIDGYERYDGYPNGAVYDYEVATITAVNPADQPSVAVGCIVSRPVVVPPGVAVVGRTPTDQVGVIVGTGSGTNSWAYVPFSTSGLLLSGQSVTITTSSGTSFSATITTGTVRGKSLASSPSQYISNLRSYSNVLRGLVTNTPTDIAGLWFMGNSLYAAVNAYMLTYTNSPFSGPFPSPGALLRHRGKLWRVLGYASLEQGDSPAPGKVRLILMPQGTSGTNDNNLVEVDASGAVGTTFGSSTSDPDATNSDWAYVVRAKNPDSGDTSRGFVAINAAFRIPFDAGSYATESLPMGPSYQYTLRNAAGTKTIDARLIAVDKTSSTFVAGTAVGYATLAIMGGEVGGSSMADNWEIWYNGARVMTVNAVNPNSDVGGAKLAGTRRIRSAKTRYQSIGANFYADPNRRAVYGATGASRAFWCRSDAFGNIYTQTDDTLDQPRYVAYHQTRLALGFTSGSVQKSVAGSPLIYNGASGATETGTGDVLTGLVEMPGDSLVIFGRSSIRRLDGSGNLTTLSSKSGAIDYTAIMIGQDVLFCGINGITTLSQTQAYGDFYGQPISGKINIWLRNKLLVDNAGFENGGVAMAYAVRSKNQYRLVLNTGESVSVAIVDGKFKITKFNHGLTGAIRVPLALSNAISDTGKEMIHVVWDKTLASAGLRGSVSSLPSSNTVIQLDSGWGFDGVTFQSYFDLAHFMPTNGNQFTHIEKVRLHGLGYGQATLDIKSAGIETDYDQDYHSAVQDISLPATPVLLRDELGKFTNKIDQANWGIGVKLRVQSSQQENLTTTEPSHVCQVLVIYLNTEGVLDD